MTGQIIKLNSGVYTVRFSDDSVLECKPRGKFRYKDENIKVGDFVEVENSSIAKVLPRKNTFIRPSISNIDYCILVMSLKRPDVDFELLDRFLINITEEKVEVIIVFTKSDLLNEDELKTIKPIIEYYQKYYNCFYSSYDGLHEKDAFLSLVENKLCVVSGQTGAGKSHLINTLDSSLNLFTQDISDSLNRGKHTTRHTEILKVLNAYIADTPGFSALDITHIKSTDLKEYYPEFVDRLNMCKFNQCMHINEPDCIVKKDTENGQILRIRYNSYLKFFNELKEIEKNKWR